MERSWYWKLLLVLGLLGLALWYAAPSAIYFLSDPEMRRSKKSIDEAIPDWLPEKRFSLGIDLQGGLHLVMGVDTEKALQDRADRLADQLVDQMKEKGKDVERAGRTGPVPEIEIVMKDEGDYSVLKELLDQHQGTWEVLSYSGKNVVFGMVEAHEAKLKDDVVAQALKTVRNRVDATGLAEPEVRKRGDNSILIQIAGVTREDGEYIKNDIIGRTAQLEFKVVDDESTFFADIAAKPDKPESVSLQYDSYEGPQGRIVSPPYLESKTKADLRTFLDKNPPPNDRVIGIQEVKENATAEPRYRSWLLSRRTPLTGDSLVDAFPYFDSEQNTYTVSMQLDRKGASIFKKLTTENTRKRMAIVLDEIVDSAPVINEPIPNGRAQISLGGYKSQEEILADANGLAIVLKAGALPAPLNVQEERTVGATLGDDAVAKGKLALTAASLLVALLIMFYYRFSGAISVVALSINLLFLVATLSAFSATLTLPGIAGLALTIGMAVDANIIQFERIREELALGKSVRSAVDAGFDKAFSAIFDANVTTGIAAIVLLQYGSGPIRGFATTLLIGVVINTFTAVVVPRLGLDWWVRGRRATELSI